MDDLLLRGIAAARGGRRAEARALLLQVVEQDERNEQAWLWLSGVMDDPADVRTCLENVLELNPENARARQGLEWLDARGAPPTDDRQPTTDNHQPGIDTGRTPTGQDQPANVEAARRQAAYDPLASGSGGREVFRATPSAPAEAVIQSAPAPSPPAPAQVHAAPTQARPAPSPGYGAAPSAAPPAPPRSARPDNRPLSAVAGQNPCPYCGTPTGERQRTCLQCHRSLMVQAPPAEHPSRWLGLLATSFWASGLVLLFGGLTLFVAALLDYQALRFAAEGQEAADAPFPLGLVTRGAVLLALGGTAFSIAGGLRRRALPAYYAVVVLVPLGLVLAAFGLLRGLPAATLAGTAIEAGAAGLLAAVLVGLLVGLAALLGIAALLGALAYRDFYGPMERFVPVIEKTDHMTHYNNGVAYKNRGMWYMAAREWEEAVSRTPRDINYLRALGLAYAQLGRFDAGREMLDRALDLAPGHAKLAEDRALVDQMAAQATK